MSHHLKVLREAGIVESERQSLWAHYYVMPDALKELSHMAPLTGECCTPLAQQTCCESSENAGCCAGPQGSGCGCSAGSASGPTLAANATLEQVRETVRERYARATQAARPGDASGVFGGGLYDDATAAEAPAAALDASLGCGVPTAVADLHAGETVLDLGSGAGADVLISARRVGPTGRAIGLDMTAEMLELARANAAEADVHNVEFVKGYLEDIPLADGTVDVVISNCVINLSGDKPQVIREAARVLRPGGRFAVADVIADPNLDERTRTDMAAWTGCIAGALTEAEFRSALENAGLGEIEITETHRVHENACSAIICARKLST